LGAPFDDMGSSRTKISVESSGKTLPAGTGVSLGCDFGVGVGGAG